MKRGSTEADGNRGSKLGRIMEAPLRALCWARDLYVSSLTGFARRTSCRGIVGYPGTAAAGFSRECPFYLPRAGSSVEDDLRELVRAASRVAVGGSPSPGGHNIGRGSWVVPRSRSVGMARIDEDRPCDFGFKAMVGAPLYPRSRSCEVPKRRLGVMS